MNVVSFTQTFEYHFNAPIQIPVHVYMHSHLRPRFIQGFMKTFLWEPESRPNEEYSTPEEQAHVSTVHINKSSMPKETLALQSVCKLAHNTYPIHLKLASYPIFLVTQG